jgi:metal-responsive CopG/Arc/MetJ family transcriptional regulator
MKNTKSVRFNCDANLVERLDEHCSRFISRTQMLEQAIRNYLVLLQQKGIHPNKQNDGRWQR